MIAHNLLGTFWDYFHQDGSESSRAATQEELVDLAKKYGCKKLYGVMGYPSIYNFVFNDDSYIGYIPGGHPGIHVGEKDAHNYSDWWNGKFYQRSIFILYTAIELKCPRCNIKDPRSNFCYNCGWKLSEIYYKCQVCKDTKVVMSGPINSFPTICSACKAVKCEKCRDTGIQSKYQEYGNGYSMVSTGPCDCGTQQGMKFQ